MKKPLMLIFLSVFLFNLILFFPTVNAGEIDSEDSTLKVGYFDYEPVSVMDENGNPEGFSIDVFEYIADEYGWNYEYVYADWEELTSMLAVGEIDLLLYMSETETRKEIYGFSQETLYYEWSTIYVDKDMVFQSIDNISGEKIGVIRGSIFYEGFKQLNEQMELNCEIIQYNSLAEMEQAVNEGEITGIAYAGMNNMVEFETQSLKSTGIIFYPTKCKVATTKGENSDILNQFDEALVALKSDENSLYYQLYNDYFTPDIHMPEWLVSVIITALSVIFIMLCILYFVVKKLREKQKTLEAQHQNLHVALSAGRMYSWEYKKESGLIKLINFGENIFYENVPLVELEVFLNKKLSQLLLQDSNSITEGFRLEYIYHQTSLWMYIVGESDSKGGYVGIVQNISKDMHQQQTIMEKVKTDSLTGLFNKQYSYHCIDTALKNNILEKKYALMYIDFDDFKHINDTFGHTYGDRVLQSVGRFLTELGQELNGVVGRVGGDEFVLFCSYDGTIKDLVDYINRRISDAHEQGISIYPIGNIKPSFSVGIEINAGGRRKTFKEMLINADIAVYEAKNRGKGIAVLYEYKMGEKVKIRNTHKLYLQNEFKKTHPFITVEHYLYNCRDEKIGVEIISKCVAHISGVLLIDDMLNFDRNDFNFRNKIIINHLISTLYTYKHYHLGNLKYVMINTNISLEVLLDQNLFDEMIEIIKNHVEIFEEKNSELVLFFKDDIIVHEADVMKIIDAFKDNNVKIGYNISVDTFKPCSGMFNETIDFIKFSDEFISDENVNSSLVKKRKEVLKSFYKYESENQITIVISTKKHSREYIDNKLFDTCCQYVIYE
jgi:diguanylate cyclase (GGDEF)-like protein